MFLECGGKDTLYFNVIQTQSLNKMMIRSELSGTLKTRRVFLSRTPTETDWIWFWNRIQSQFKPKRTEKAFVRVFYHDSSDLSR